MGSCISSNTQKKKLVYKETNHSQKQRSSIALDQNRPSLKENNFNNYFNDKNMKSLGKQFGKESVTVDTEEQTTTSKFHIADSYKFLKVIGIGQFGKVRLAQNFKGKYFAIKSILKEQASEKMYLLKRELNIMKSIDHPNLVKFHETYNDSKYFHIVMEYIEGIDLQTYCQERFSLGNLFEEEEVALIIKKVLSAVSYLHSKNILHRDLKPQNIIVNPDILDVKILDFGLSRDFSNGVHESARLLSFVGTPLFVAPELIKEQVYNEKCDIWSLGVLTYYMLSGGKHPFQGSSLLELFKKICAANCDFSSESWKKVSKEAIQFIQKMLLANPQDRISSHFAQKCSWLQDTLSSLKTIKIDNLNECQSLLKNIISSSKRTKFTSELIQIIFNQLLSASELNFLKMAFEALDLDDAGYISSQQLYNAVKQVNLEIKIEQIQDIFEIINSGQYFKMSNSHYKISHERNQKNNSLKQSLVKLEEIDLKQSDLLSSQNQDIFLDIQSDNEEKQNKIHFNGFIHYAINLSSAFTNQTQIQLFDLMDKDKDGYIGINDLKEVFAKQGRKLHPQMLNEMIAEVDADKDGKISLFDFQFSIQKEIDVFESIRQSLVKLKPSKQTV